MDNELYCPMKMTSNPLGRCVCEKEKCIPFKDVTHWMPLPEPPKEV